MTTDTGKTGGHAGRDPAAGAGERPHGDPSALPTFVLGIIGAVFVLLIVIALETLYYGAQRGEDRRKFVEQPSEELQSVLAEQREELNGYRWVDQTKGSVAIPIDRAMEITMRDLNAARGGTP